MSDPSHPLWGIIRLVVLMVSMLIVLAIFASKFDWTEIRTLLIMFFVAAGLEFQAVASARKAVKRAIEAMQKMKN